MRTIRLTPLHALLAAIALMIAALPGAAHASAMSRYVQTADNFVILFDSSGSMAAPYAPSGTDRLNAAIDLLKAVNRDIPEFDYTAALYTFTPWQEYYGPKPYDKAAFDRAIDALPKEVAGGRAFGPPTPIGEAMWKLSDLIKDFKGRTVVILFSDGINTDGRDPIRYARSIASRHDVCFMVVSLATTPRGRELLNGIATASPCSVNVDFDYAVRNPEVCTGQLCSLVPLTEVVVVEEERFIPVTSIWFDFDKSDIKPWAATMLDAAAAELKKDSRSTIYLAGFTDTTGPEKYNQGLSMRRALAAKEYLVSKHGIGTERIVARWYGEDGPAATNETAAGRRLNRRVEFVIVPGK